VAVLYFLAEEPIQDRQQQDCCLIVEVHIPDRVDDQWVQPAAENAIEEEFGKALTLWSADEDEALQYLRLDPGATRGLLDLRSGVPLVWHLLPIVWSCAPSTDMLLCDLLLLTVAKARKVRNDP
jgi:hypothetical protein